MSQFYNAFRVQFVCAAFFRRNNGALKGSAFEIKKALSNIDLVLFEQGLRESEELSDLRDTYVQIQLPVMRKLFAAVYTLKQLDKNSLPAELEAGEPQVDALKDVCNAADD